MVAAQFDTLLHTQTEIKTMHPHRNHQPARATPRWVTIAQTLFVAAIVAALTVITILELSK